MRKVCGADADCLAIHYHSLCLPHARPFVGVFQESVSISFVNFWRYFPAKRGNGSKNEDGIPPRRAFCGEVA